ncbi:L-arabinokinase [Sesamum indicum]|uniref:L-arabinokinase n=1 Tax=Sesamum indicum TaxID=4182 RepID=A0A6I9T3X3_SESIN|nr:L-arabinokinase [Sesamum indicum]XP_011077669.1 L-arabinokinase [Sesamum indicum]
MEKKPLVFAYYVTGHGFGHATRVLEVVRNLILAGHEVHVVTGVPDYIFTTEIKSARLFIRKVLLDCGAVQADALTVDRLASLEKYVQTAVVPRDSILATEVEWLKSINANLVASDAVPIACRAAADAGIRAVCVTNFSWDFIYAEYVMVAGRQSHSIIWQIAEDYSHCDFLIRLPGYCPMPAFSDVVDAPLVVRKLHKSRAEVRKELGIEEDAKVLIYNFGGQPAGWKLEKEYLPDGWICLVCGASDEQELPENFVKLPKDVYTPDLIAASDCMLGKIGYGTASEALAYKVPLIFVRRDYFNEEPFVRNMLEYCQCGVEIIRRDLLSGRWAPYIQRAITLKPCYEGGTNGGEVVAQILHDIALGKDPTPSKLRGSRRLKDAIVLGYQLQGVSGKDIDVPHWYTLAQTELSSRTPLPDENSIQNTTSAIGTGDFEILHGDHHGLSDTIGFLKSLKDLHALSNNANSSKHQSRESLAAAAMINWEEEIVVTRAPGRLDVMGGIADYSGSLVLQMPVREACHVAIQRCRPEKQKLWKHAQARQQKKGDGTTPVLQIVSFGSELSNRAPTFDMDLFDFLEDGKPISYEKARLYFAQDPSQKWAAYVAGTILVLMTELGIQFQDGISILVSSGVPEGKGVSSSAAIEVATMSAVAASHGLNIAPRDLALLCQKVENHIVGAPCGVMDQMASACGEENKLLAMLCQPAEVLGHVEIPSHIRFWGIDSGIRHSVGGADYGSVRIGTFMGRKMIKSMASKQLSSPNHNSPKVEGMNNDETDEHGKDLLQAEAALDYLCNLSPHRYESYVHRLPEFLPGNEFIENYNHHDDSITIIDKKCSYAVRAPTRHPIYENFRVKAFKALLSAAPSDDQLSTLGELMYQCHYSYSACGLGSDGTDKLVELVQQKQHSKSTGGTLFGAKITGGGSGGTVCVIGKNLFRSSEQIFKIQQKYKAITGFLPFVFEGSSPGAGKFGYLKLRMRSRSS